MNASLRPILRPIRRAFSLVELLVVISIFVLLLALAVPAFSSMLYSSEQALAESSLRVAMNTARNVAVASPRGQDSAAVFLYDSVSKKTTILICTKAGVLSDAPASGSNSPVDREVFAAAPGVEPVQLSAGWTVRGYAPANTIDDEWYGDGTYQNATLRQQGNWLFPETNFYDDTQRNDGQSRQTFMVRFEGGTGVVKLSDPREVLVLAPSESIVFRNGWPLGGYPDPLNALDEADPVRFVKRVLAWPTYATVTGSINVNLKRQILGDVATDTILTKPIGQLALCRESRLAQAIGVRLDAATGSLYQNLTDPVFAPNVNVDRINAWIEDRLDDGSGGKVESDCRIFTLQRYLGWLQEVTGTSGGLGVGS
ncbi:MAG: type II secretion system protein [Phycisphaeraceae bacterium]|nr:type II secretion system protein [Phycisphaeraceae bacterium]